MHIWTQQAQQESAWASEKVALDEKKQATTHSAQSGACLPQRNQQAQRPCVQVCGGGGLKMLGNMFGNYQKEGWEGEEWQQERQPQKNGT